MATNSIRTTVKRALFDELRDNARLEGVAVDYCVPRKGLRERHVFLGDVEGDMDYPVTRGTRFYRDDTFSITVWLRAENRADDTGDKADEDVEALFHALEDIFAEVPSDQPLGIAEIRNWSVGDVKGPYPMATERGYESMMQVGVSFTCRLS